MKIWSHKKCEMSHKDISLSQHFNQPIFEGTCQIFLCQTQIYAIINFITDIFENLFNGSIYYLPGS